MNEHLNPIEMPSFWIGLSQEEASVAMENPNPITFVEATKEQDGEVMEQRKSKRPRLVPAGLQDYKCDLKVTAGYYIIPDLEERFKLMEQTVAKHP